LACVENTCRAGATTADCFVHHLSARDAWRHAIEPNIELGPLRSEKLGQRDNASLAALYAERMGHPPMPQIEAMLTTQPLRRGIIVCATACVMKNTPLSMTSICARQ